ncbi:MAG: hypothetical protein ACRC23_01465 [Aeromonas jandaei]
MKNKMMVKVLVNGRRAAFIFNSKLPTNRIVDEFYNASLEMKISYNQLSVTSYETDIDEFIEAQSKLGLYNKTTAIFFGKTKAEAKIQFKKFLNHFA